MTSVEEGRAQDRLAIVIGLRVGGALLVATGVWMTLGGSFAGRYGFGGVLLVAGAIGGVALPALLTRRWRTLGRTSGRTLGRSAGRTWRGRR